MPGVALITGSVGGIGGALVRRFLGEGYRVIGLDWREPARDDGAEFIQIDLGRLCEDAAYRESRLGDIASRLPESGLDVLINNAALQIVAPTNEISLADWKRVMDVNVTAPFLLIQAFLRPLQAARGSVINISSIHEQLTKPGFAAYATSKAALTGLTRALAVDLGSRVRINAIVPAAIETEMLKAGFAAKPDKLQDLKIHHPTGKIGQPDEVAQLAVFLASKNNRFLNGTIVTLDGGISSRLHDPA